MEMIDQRNIELGKVLFSLRQGIDLDKIIGLNADSINKKGIGKRFFAHIQMLAIESIDINICKVFEKEKKYPLNSIPAILNIIKINIVNRKCTKPIDEFISKYGSSSKNKIDYVETLEDVSEDFYTKHKISFEKCGYARDKVIVHTEYQTQRRPLPSHQIMEEILMFGVDFYCMINRAFLGVGPHPIDTDKQVSSSLCRLFEKIGFKNIITEFDK